MNAIGGDRTELRVIILNCFCVLLRSSHSHIRYTDVSTLNSKQFRHQTVLSTKQAPPGSKVRM